MHSEIIQPGQPIIEVFLPTYRMEPDEDERFYPSVAKKIAEEIVQAELNDQEYDEEDAKTWSLIIGDKIRDAVKKNMNIPRYKIIVQSTVGQLRDQGIRIASRCLWDVSTDNYTSVSYTNQTIFCNVLIFALYTD
mmetsp:Transcript_24762/g.36523  ORF Transcript_24762/g.36523 Transcript_24762/m.36523 type:complete len:135 (-) Transcript_24762:141-545(-)|eukprot:CAMPEP_0185025258 /NCGR_PEP_ID=MMETSP1103-20130426/8283_1 /TAXON_ID=36769 /ORGANISM="Paraphysomonas bandaiensis, Strain Caron Lab Isolate" /LENGTH=134 /DNA_ID=CAMNT_0027558411 /DNA_START=100 /DNA_END=504 /DNA_ORIENTATION=-